MHIGGHTFADTEVQFPIEEIQPSYVAVTTEDQRFRLDTSTII